MPQSQVKQQTKLETIYQKFDKLILSLSDQLRHQFQKVVGEFRSLVWQDNEDDNALMLYKFIMENSNALLKIARALNNFENSLFCIHFVRQVCDLDQCLFTNIRLIQKGQLIAKFEEASLYVETVCNQINEQNMPKFFLLTAEISYLVTSISLKKKQSTNALIKQSFTPLEIKLALLLSRKTRLLYFLKRQKNMEERNTIIQKELNNQLIKNLDDFFENDFNDHVSIESRSLRYLYFYQKVIQNIFNQYESAKKNNCFEEKTFFEEIWFSLLDKFSYQPGIFKYMYHNAAQESPPFLFKAAAVTLVISPMLALATLALLKVANEKIVAILGLVKLTTGLITMSIFRPQKLQRLADSIIEKKDLSKHPAYTYNRL